MTGSDGLPDAALDAMASSAAVLDAEGEIVYTNAAWRAFGEAGGVSGDPSMIGTNYLAVCEASFHDEYASDAHDGLRRLLDGREDHFRLEYPCPSEETPEAWYLLLATAFDHADEPHVLVEHVDITERKRYERELLDRNERLSTVSSVLSHDLRNPMSIALGYAEQLAADPSPDAADVWDLVETDGATLEHGRELTLEADRSLLMTVFQNLFRNAIEHGADDVTITVGALEDGRGFYVEDDGPGIPAERRDDVLDAGYSTGSGGEHSGLGLSIVANAVAVHDWELTVTESATLGARFEVRVPDDPSAAT